jgi:phosphatidylinositol alpha-1,6-mannosyltransferase
MKIKRLTKMAMSVDSLHVLASAYHLIKKEKIDIICCGEACLALQLPAAFLHSLFKIPWYSFVHGTDFLHVKRIWEQKLLSLLSRTASGILANSEYTRIKFVQFAGIDPNRTHVVHPGLDPLFIEKAITDERERINNNDYSILLTVGRLIDRKGQDMVIRALPKIINHVPKLKYRIIGEGPYRANLEKLAKELMVNEYVEFIGPVQDSDLIREYKSCDLFVMPSRESAEDIEGFGIVYLEASACGKPIIGGKSGGVSDAVLDNQTGILVDPTNIDEIANSVVNLLKNPLLAERLGKHGRERVLKKFTSNHMAIRILQIISESS